MPFRPRSRHAADPLDEPALYDWAVRALGRRMRTVAELERMLRTKAAPGEEGGRKIASVLERLREQRYLDDAAFAVTFARLRQENEGFGRRRVERELARKGVDRDIIARAADAAYAETGEEELARLYLARKHIAKPRNAKETARVVRRLSGAGFSIATLSRILKNWEIEFTEDDLAPPVPEDGTEQADS